MAVTWMTGCEAAAAAVDGITLTGTAAYSTAQARTGTRSLRCNPGSGASGYATTSVSVGGYVHFGLYVAALPSVTRSIVGNVATFNPNVRINSDGTLSYYEAATLRGTTSIALSTGQWYWIGARFGVGTGVVAIQIDGANALTCDTTVAGGLLCFGCEGTEASAIDIYIDDAIVDGAGFLAPSKVALLLPISDNARTEWTNGTGGTTNLYDAVNNVPPAGLATETATSQIEHPGSGGGSGAYAANMTTYATAGLSVGDTVLAAQSLIVCGEDSATGTKQIGWTLLSNPGGSGVTPRDVSSGDGSGATLNYGAGPPDYWNEDRGAIATSPSVDLSGSCVMRVTRPETASRVASVCFMGMYVAWTPYVAPPASNPFPLRVYPQLLAH